MRVIEPRGEIDLVDVTFGYRADQPVLRGINLSIRPGAKIALVGPSGSGKSSLLNLLMRLYDPDRGQVLFDGADLRTLDLETMLAYFGVVPQSTFLFEGSMYDNIAFGFPDATPHDIVHAAQLAGLSETIGRLPEGIETYLGRRDHALRRREAADRNCPCLGPRSTRPRPRRSDVQPRPES